LARKPFGGVCNEWSIQQNKQQTKSINEENAFLILLWTQTFSCRLSFQTERQICTPSQGFAGFLFMQNPARLFTQSNLYDVLRWNFLVKAYRQ